MPTKYLLPEDQIPRAWLNIVPSLPSPPPPALHPGTLQPVDRFGFVRSTATSSALTPNQATNFLFHAAG